MCLTCASIIFENNDGFKKCTFFSPPNLVRGSHSGQLAEHWWPEVGPRPFQKGCPRGRSKVGPLFDRRVVPSFVPKLGPRFKAKVGLRPMPKVGPAGFVFLVQFLMLFVLQWLKANGARTQKSRSHFRAKGDSLLHRKAGPRF